MIDAQQTPDRSPGRADDDALARLQARVTRLEDREEIARLVARYGPAVDSGSAVEVAGLWQEDGTYAFSMGDDLSLLAGRAGLEEMVRGPHHQGIILGGAGHFLGPAHIEVDGDRAVATGYSVLVRHDADTERYYVDRLAANRWELRRTASGWLVERRVNQLLDGRPAARELLGAASSLDHPGGC